MEKSQPYYVGYGIPEDNPKVGSAPRNIGINSFDVAPPQYSWFEEAQRNKPQSNSLGAALFIFASGGMSLAWSVGFRSTFENLCKGAEMHLQVCWFIAVILGSIAASILINKITKRMFNIIASVLVIVNGILFLAASQYVAAIAIARYCDGIAFGMTVVPAIMAGSEQSVKLLRGLVLSIESIGISMGIMLQAIYFNLWANDVSFTTTKMHGILAVVYGALALIFACFLTIESPSFYLRRNQDAQAIECLRKLQRPRIVTTETYSLYYEDKKMVEEDEARGMSVNFKSGLIPLVKVCFFRVIVSMSFSLPISLAIVSASAMEDPTDPQVEVIFYGTLRSMGPVVAIFTLDSLGRKYPSAIAMILAGGIMIGVGSMYAGSSYPTGASLGVVVGLLLTYQFIAGFYAATSTVYLGEAFSISVKPYFISITVIVESIVQIIICCAYDATTSDFFVFGIIFGLLQILCGVMIYVAMPETKKTTMREALRMFKTFFSLGQ